MFGVTISYSNVTNQLFHNAKDQTDVRPDLLRYITRLLIHTTDHLCGITGLEPYANSLLRHPKEHLHHTTEQECRAKSLFDGTLVLLLHATGYLRDTTDLLRDGFVLLCHRIGLLYETKIRVLVEKFLKLGLI